jgi:hypothetical protein
MTMPGLGWEGGAEEKRIDVIGLAFRRLALVGQDTWPVWNIAFLDAQK